MRLAFVTGRGLQTVIPLLNDPVIPSPDYIICDVGATVVYGYTLRPIEPLQGEIRMKWPGTKRVLDLLEDVEGLQYQHVPQHRRCSFFVKDEAVVNTVKNKVEELGFDVIWSAGRFLDVLPQGVNKGSSLINLINLLGYDKEEVMVAGDTLNDLSMYQCGFRGVVVGNAEDKLRAAVAELPEIYCAETTGAGGILEAIEYFDFKP